MKIYPLKPGDRKNCTLLNSPRAPSDIGSSYYTLEDIYNRLNSGTDGTLRVFTEPTTTAGAIYTLTEIMAKAPAVDNTSGAAITDVLAGKTFWGLTSPGAWGLQTGNVPAGGNVTGTNGTKAIPILTGLYSGSTTATANDTELVTGNIKSGANIFGVGGKSTVVDTADATANATQISNGETAYVNGSKLTGNLAGGVSCATCVATSTARWCNNNNGTVTDKTTGLIWTKIAVWVQNNLQSILISASLLSHGYSDSGVTDGSAPGAWRLPTKAELTTMSTVIDAGVFTITRNSGYWSSTYATANTAYYLEVGTSTYDIKTFSTGGLAYLWAVK